MAGNDSNLPSLPAGYKYVKELASGAQGTVWLVLNQNMGMPGRQEAVKLLQQLGDKEQQRFFREISTLAELNHPNIVTIYYANPKDSYFIMEYLPGGSLAQYLKKRPLVMEDALKIIRQIAEGLDFAHSRHMIHRDLKPANILFSSQMVPKITDFGLAKLKSCDEDGITAPQISLGTPHYMSPEQWENSQVVDQRADIWSLGIILYQVLTGHTPFHGLSEANLMYAVLMKPIPLPHEVNPQLSPLGMLAEKICQRALQKKPEQRYQKAAEMVEELRQIVQQPTAPQQVSLPQEMPIMGAQSEIRPEESAWQEDIQEVLETETQIDKPALQPKASSLLLLPDEERVKESEPEPETKHLPAFLGDASPWLVLIYQYRLWLAAIVGIMVLTLGAWSFMAPPSLERLRKDILGGSEERKMLALQALEKRGTEASQVVTLALNIHSFNLRKQAKQILKKWGNEVIPDVIAVVENESGQYNVDARIEALQILGEVTAQDAEKVVYDLAISSKNPDNLRQAAIDSLLRIAPRYQKYYHCEDGIWYSTSELEKKGYVRIDNTWQQLAVVLDPAQRQLTAANQKWQAMQQEDWKKKVCIVPVQEEILQFVALSWDECFQSFRTDKLLATVAAQEAGNTKVQAALTPVYEQTLQGALVMLNALREAALAIEPDKPVQAFELYLHAARKCEEALAWQWSPARQDADKLQQLAQELRLPLEKMRPQLTLQVALRCTGCKDVQQATTELERNVCRLFRAYGKLPTFVAARDQIDKQRGWFVFAYQENLAQPGEMLCAISFWAVPTGGGDERCFWNHTITPPAEVQQQGLALAQVRQALWEQMQRWQPQWQVITDTTIKPEKPVAEAALWDVVYLKDNRTVKGLIEKETKDAVSLSCWQENVVKKVAIPTARIARIERLDPAVRQNRLLQLKKGKK